MDIPNLSQTPPLTVKKFPIHLAVIPLIVLAAIALGFGLSRSFPGEGSSSLSDNSLFTNNEVVSTDEISGADDIKVGKTYGLVNKEYKDSATGKIEKGSINGEGTHILIREGGVDQRAALTSSAIDLDLFIDHQVEVKGETNSSKKAGWLIDVGSVKVLE